MRASRVLIVTLALLVSPAAAAACEVVCGMGPHAAHEVPAPQPVAVDEHAHHGHHPTPVPERVIVPRASTDDLSISVPAPECDLRVATPARIRTASIDAAALAAAITTAAYRVDHVLARRVRAGDLTASPPSPPLTTPLPLRI